MTPGKNGGVILFIVTETTGLAGEGCRKKALASIIKRSETLKRELKNAYRPAVDELCPFTAVGQVLQEKELSVRRDLLAGGMPFPSLQATCKAGVYGCNRGHIFYRLR